MICWISRQIEEYCDDVPTVYDCIDCGCECEYDVPRKDAHLSADELGIKCFECAEKEFSELQKLEEIIDFPF